MNYRTGYHSYNDLVKLTESLKFLKYFPALDHSFSTSDSLRVGVESQGITEEGWRKFESEIRAAARNLGFVAAVGDTIVFFALEQCDLTPSHFKASIDLEAILLQIMSRYSLQPARPQNWQTLGFVPD